MPDVSIAELRNRVGDLVERAQQGERLTITRAGKPVAELGPTRPSPTPLDELRWR